MNFIYTYKCKECAKEKIVKVSSKKKAKKHSNICRSCYNKLHRQNSKPVTLKNLITGEVRSAKSITDFANELGLGKNAKYHFSLILSGERLHHKGWALNKEYKVKSIRKNEQFVIEIEK